MPDRPQKKSINLAQHAVRDMLAPKKGIVDDRTSRESGNGRKTRKMTISERINKAFEKEEWARAREIIAGELAKSPNDHWLLTRLSTTYYEERNYDEALKHVQKAQKRAPDCPLVLWDLAGILYALGKFKKALTIYQRIVQQGPKGIASHPHGEGLPWAISLWIDSVFRAAVCLQSLGMPKKAKRFYEIFVRVRGDWHGGIYSMQDAEQQMEKLEKPSSEDMERRVEKVKEDLLAV